MKRLLNTLVTLALLLLPLQAIAAGSATVAVVDTQEEYSCTVVWTASATDGTFTAKGLGTYHGSVTMVVTDPGGTAPTAAYDITITDAQSCDVMGGTLADRSDTASEQATPKIGAVYGPRPVSGTLTLNVTNNAVNSATGTVKIYFSRL